MFGLREWPIDWKTEIHYELILKWIWKSKINMCTWFLKILYIFNDKNFHLISILVKKLSSKELFPSITLKIDFDIPITFMKVKNIIINSVERISFSENTEKSFPSVQTPQSDRCQLERKRSSSFHETWTSFGRMQLCSRILTEAKKKKIRDRIASQWMSRGKTCFLWMWFSDKRRRRFAVSATRWQLFPPPEWRRQNTTQRWQLSWSSQPTTSSCTHGCEWNEVRSKWT